LHLNLDLRQLNQMYKVKIKKVSSKKMSLQEKVKRKLSRKLYLSDWKIT
jgi:hypothetical protein